MEYKFDVQIEWGNDVAIAEMFRSKAIWLGEQFARDLKDERIKLNGVRFQNSVYILSFTTSGNRLTRAVIDRDIVDDMCDPEKPQPETKARFKALIIQKMQAISEGKV